MPRLWDTPRDRRSPFFPAPNGKRKNRIPAIITDLAVVNEDTLTPTWSWAASPGAFAYVFQLATESDFSDATEYEVTDTEWTPDDDLANVTTYYARVAPVGVAGPSGWSDSVSVLVYDYIAYVLGVQPTNLIAYWPLSEASGSVADNAEGTAARDGVYDTVGTLLNNTPFDANTGAPYFDGTANADVNAYTASLAAAINLNSITLNVWVKPTSGAWTDAAARTIAVFGAALNDRITIRKTATNNVLQFEQRGSDPSLDFNTIDHTTSAGERAGWIMCTLTFTGGGNLRGYINGVETGTPQAATSIAGALGAIYAIIGGFSATGTEKFVGHIAHVAIWTTPLSAAQILALYNAANPT